jgi:hypothetical protein
VASALDKKCIHSDLADAPAFEVCFSSLLLPVNETGATRPAEVLLAGGAQDFDAVLHMGLENGAKGLKLETMGVNALGSMMNENFPAIPGAPRYLPITADLGRSDWAPALCPVPTADRLAAAPLMRARRLRCRLKAADARAHRLEIPELLDVLDKEIWSRDAGLFFCNEVLYRTMHAIRSTPLILRGTKSTLLPAIFVHLPCPDDVPPNEKVYCPTTNATSELITMVGKVATRLVAPNIRGAGDEAP